MVNFRNRYNGSIAACVSSIFARQGVRGFYRGYQVTILTSGPSSALTLCANDVLLSLLRHGDLRMALFGQGTSGGTRPGRGGVVCNRHGEG